MKNDCSQWFKDTNLKANHNLQLFLLQMFLIVPNGSKILIWKQITTLNCYLRISYNCSQWFKDTNLKANHNLLQVLVYRLLIVPNGSKILIWKQITTQSAASVRFTNCSQWFKDTNLKANHNSIVRTFTPFPIVPNGSKILIWKQITTFFLWSIAIP